MELLTRTFLVSKASELALIIAQYLDNDCPLVVPDHAHNTMPTIDIAARKGDGTDLDSAPYKVMDSKAIEGLRAILRHKGFNVNGEETFQLINSLGKFLAQCYREEGDMLEKQKGKDEVEAGSMEMEVLREVETESSKGKEAENVVKEAAVDGHSWAKKYLPKGGFWGC